MPMSVDVGMGVAATPRVRDAIVSYCNWATDRSIQKWPRLHRLYYYNPIAVGVRHSQVSQAHLSHSSSLSTA